MELHGVSGGVLGNGSVISIMRLGGVCACYLAFVNAVNERRNSKLK